jgi:hypothetical protein
MILVIAGYLANYVHGGEDYAIQSYGFQFNLYVGMYNALYTELRSASTPSGIENSGELGKTVY